MAVYTDAEKETLKSVFNMMSSSRLAPYFEACNKSPYDALNLYKWNSQMAGALHETIGHFEVIFRNRIDDAMCSRHAFKSRPGDWLDDGHREFKPKASDALEDARERTRNKRAGTRGHTVAELNFGFWIRLLDKSNEAKFGGAIMRMFPELKRTAVNDMENLRQLVDPLYQLRNRIAHHEPIWLINHAARRDDALRVIGYCGEDLKGWVQSKCRVDEVLRLRPA
jgi:hypothetical protein